MAGIRYSEEKSDKNGAEAAHSTDHAKHDKFNIAILKHIFSCSLRLAGLYVANDPEGFSLFLKILTPRQEKHK